MKHEHYQELLVLSLYEELSEPDKVSLAEHLQTCPECEAELLELKKLHSFVDSGISEPSALLLREARAQLHGALRSESVFQSAQATAAERLSHWMSVFRVPLAAAACLVLGLWLGYLSFGTSSTHMPADDPFALGDTAITNIRLLDQNPEDGMVEVSFEAVRPVQVQGNVSDPQIQRVLAQALLRSRNPGVRLRAVSAIERRPVPSFDPEVKRALILSLKFDDNTGVRTKALEALQGLVEDPAVREAMLYVLINDQNPGMRVSAIGILEKSPSREWQSDDELLDLLEQRIDKEQNKFVRLRSKAFLQEVRFQ